MHVMSLARPQQRAVGTEFDRLIVVVLRFVDDADALHDTMTHRHRRSIYLVRPCGGRYFSGSETNRSIPKRWERNLATSCPLTLFPALSNGGEEVPKPPLPGGQGTNPPPLPLLPAQPPALNKQP